MYIFTQELRLDFYFSSYYVEYPVPEKLDEGVQRAS